MNVDDITVEILKQIRDGVDQLGNSLGERIDRLGVSKLEKRRGS